MLLFHDNKRRASSNRSRRVAGIFIFLVVFVISKPFAMLWQRLFGFFSFFGFLKGLGQILELLGFTGFLSGPIGIDVLATITVSNDLDVCSSCLADINLKNYGSLALSEPGSVWGG